MTVIESLPIALFCLAMVFAVLGCLFILIKLFSFGLGVIEGIGNKSIDVPITSAPIPSSEDKSEFSLGELRLYNVDERTAAMIMAIVSDESGIPLSELCFKSIKPIEKTRYS